MHIHIYICLIQMCLADALHQSVPTNAGAVVYGEISTGFQAS